MSLNLDELEKVAKVAIDPPFPVYEAQAAYARTFTPEAVLALIARIRELEEGGKGSSRDHAPSAGDARPSTRPEGDLVAELVEGLRPFARYAEAIKHMGGNYPKSGPLIAAETRATGLREVLVEEFERAADLVARAEQGSPPP